MGIRDASFVIRVFLKKKKHEHDIDINPHRNEFWVIANCKHCSLWKVEATAVGAWACGKRVEPETPGGRKEELQKDIHGHKITFLPHTYTHTQKIFLNINMYNFIFILFTFIWESYLIYGFVFLLLYLVSGD